MNDEKFWRSKNWAQNNAISSINKTEKTVRRVKKNKELPHELFLTKGLQTEIRNTFANNVSVLKKLVKFNCLKSLTSQIKSLESSGTLIDIVSKTIKL